MRVDLKQVATILDRDVTHDPSLKKLQRAMAAYGFAMGMYRGGKQWYEKLQIKLEESRLAGQYVINVEESDRVYYPLYRWILSNQVVNDEHRLIVNTSVERTDDPDNEFEDPSYGVEIELGHEGDLSNETEIDGHHIVIKVVRGGFDLPPGGQVTTGATYVFNKPLKHPDSIQFVVDTLEACDAVQKFLVELYSTFLKEENKRGPRNPRLKIGRFGYWGHSGSLRLRPIESVVLRDGQLEPIIADLQQFLRAEKDYIRRAIPWHRGYLFYGPPGTGKTSLAMGLASHFGLDIYYLPLGDIDKDVNLMEMISGVSERSILLCEDVDTFAQATKRSKEKGEASMSALLNALDGAMTPHGLITIMTTNDISALDDAIIRPGRIDRTEEITVVDKKQGSRLFRSFYPDSDQESADRVGANCVGLVPASILEVCKRNLDDYRQAVDELTDPKFPSKAKGAKVARTKDVATKSVQGVEPAVKAAAVKAAGSRPRRTATKATVKR